MLPNAQPKPRPKLLEIRVVKSGIAAVDRRERAKCRRRSGGQCEVIEIVRQRDAVTGLRRTAFLHCARRVSENHHLIGGIGRRNRGRSILAAHRLDVCQRCHEDITGNVLVPVDGTKKEHAATVRYERIR